MFLTKLCLFILFIYQISKIHSYPSWINVDVHVVRILDPGSKDAISRAESVTQKLKKRNIFTEIETAFELGLTVRDFAAHLRFRFRAVM